MEFKIDTRPSYLVFKPLTVVINASLTEAIRQKHSELGQSVSPNLLIDLSNCTEIDNSALPAFLALHEEFYDNNHSLVFTGLDENIAKELQPDKEDLSINLVPTMAEAIDIINMEILERELFNE